MKNWYINANSSKDDKTKDFGLLDVDRQHPVGGGEDGGGDGEAESQGTCIPIFFKTSFIFNTPMMMVLNLTWQRKQHLLLPDDPCDLAKALKELPR